MKANTVKIDVKLLKEVKRFISKKENRIKYPTTKNFIDQAVSSALNNMEKKKKRILFIKALIQAIKRKR